MNRPTYTRRFLATEGIPGVCSGGEVIIINPAHEEGILVSRWIPWSDLGHVMKHLSSLEDIDEFHERPDHLALVTD